MSISGNEMYGFATKTVNVGGSAHGGIIVSTLNDAQTSRGERWRLNASNTGGTSQFTGFTSTIVQILTQNAPGPLEPPSLRYLVAFVTA
jgi:hypothetical protein